MNLPQCWQIWQILKLALRPAVCMLGLMCQRVGPRSSPCSPTGTWRFLQENISWHFPWQLAMISALSTTVGERMIAKWPNKIFFFFSPKDGWCLSVCVFMCVASFVSVSVWDLKFQNYFWYLFERLNSTLNFFLTFNNTQQMCSARLNSTSVSTPESIFVQIGIARRRKTQLHSS